MKEIISKYSAWIVGLTMVGILLIVRSCNNQQVSELRGKNEALSEQVKQVKDGVEVAETIRLRQRDSINAENARKDQTIAELEKGVAKSKEVIQKLSNELDTTKENVKNMSLVKKAETLNSIYGGNNAVALENSIDIKGELPSQVLETYYDMDYYRKVNVEKDSQLSKKDSIVTTVKSQLSSTKTLLITAESSIKSFQELSDLQNDLNKSLEKENKKLRTKSTLNTLLLPVGIFLGVIGTNMISK